MASADDLIHTLDRIQVNSFPIESERVRVRDALIVALRRVQSPWDLVWEHNWVNPATNASIKTLIDVGLFKKWAEAGWKSQTSTELAAFVGADESLISMY